MRHYLRHRLFRYHPSLHRWRRLFTDDILALFGLIVLILIAPAVSATRFQQRGLFMQSSLPGVTTSYTLSLHYITPSPVGSLDMKFCENPIPYMPCDVPPGLDVSHAVLSSQTGETGFTITQQSQNHILISRTPNLPTSTGLSAYKLSGITNTTDTSQAFSIRLKSLGSMDGTGAQIDFGSVRGQVTQGIKLETQVPPMLIFCLAEQVADDCISTNDVYYSDLGHLSPNSTLTTQSQMGVGTNASRGFVIAAYGTPPNAGIHAIDGLTTPTKSTMGTNQFGINLVANNQPIIGHDPEGVYTNAVTAPGYGIPNQYKYVSGDMVAYSPNVSLMRKFTVSYILNSASNLKPGVYTTTINFIASGRF